MVKPLAYFKDTFEESAVDAGTLTAVFDLSQLEIKKNRSSRVQSLIVQV